MSRICHELDQDLEAFRTRPLEGGFPYVFCDATYVKGRVGGRVVSRAVVVATGVSAAGARRCWAWRSATPRTGRYGRPSCARCGPGG